MTKKIIFTIGHSNRTSREFIKILKAFDIETLVDVRHYPGSLHCPQFGKVRIRNNLKRNNIGYEHLLALGGRRRVTKDLGINDAWRSPQFRGYADYMQTAEFNLGLEGLIKISKNKTVAIMCAEAVPWRCHRSMISDALIARKFTVIDIINEKNSRVHKLTSFAKITKNKKVFYPKGPENEKASEV